MLAASAMSSFGYLTWVFGAVLKPRSVPLREVASGMIQQVVCGWRRHELHVVIVNLSSTFQQIDPIRKP